MRDQITNLMRQLAATSTAAKIATAVGALLAVTVAGAWLFRAANPTMVFLYGGIDDRTFGRVTTALAGGSVRFKTSQPPGPYTLWVAKPDYQRALRSIHEAGAMSANPTGIDTGTSGASTVFLGAPERMQITQKRLWEEVQKQLKQLDWVSDAYVTASPGAQNRFLNETMGTVSVVLRLRGVLGPSRQESMTAAKIVQQAFGVPRENVVISDHSGRSIFDGSSDSELDDVLEHERRWSEIRTREAQRYMDEAFGRGLTRVSVRGEFKYDETESLNQGIAATKHLLSEETVKTETPMGTEAGGPASVSAVLNQNNAGNQAVAAQDSATTNETRKEYVPSRNMSYTKSVKPTLMRMTVSLVVDESLSDRQDAAKELLSGVVGLDKTRDTLHSALNLLPGIERDESGLPLPPQEPEVPEQTNPMIFFALERGIEILAALAFLIILAKGLKKAGAKPVEDDTTASVLALTDELDENIDRELLARRRVEDLLANEPEKVGALLSRWALDPKLRN